MERGLRVVVASLPVAVAALALVAAAPSAATNRLQRVWLSGGAVHASFRLPAGMQAYGLSFAHPGEPIYPVMLLPGVADGTVTASSFTSKHLTAENLTSTDYRPDGTLKPKSYTVRLIYGRRGGCGGSPSWNYDNLSWNAMMRCPHLRSNPVPLSVGLTIGPGALIGSSSGSGAYADASVSGNVKSPNRLTVRISSTPSGQSVHVVWTITCTKGQNVKGASGSWDDATPVDDGSSIRIPFASALSSPDACTYAVGASLTPDPSSTDAPSGTISLKLYVDKSHI